MKTRRVLIACAGVVLASAYIGGYCSARAHLRLVHRCFAGEDESDKLFLTSRGGHRIGRPMFPQGGEASRTFEFYFYSPLRWAEGRFWDLHYRSGDRLAHADPRRYRWANKTLHATAAAPGSWPVYETRTSSLQFTSRSGGCAWAWTLAVAFMRPLQAVILLVALSLCAAWAFLTWPGSSSHGHFYAYPVTLPLFGFWAVGWFVILVPTFFILRKTKKKWDGYTNG